jgi:hypothetical protein
MPRLLRIALMSLAFTGCRLTRPDPATGVLVRDAETGQPVPAAVVRVSNFVPTSGTRAPDASAPTGADGLAWVRVPATENESAIVAVSADGYLPAVISLRNNGPGADPGSRHVAEVFAGPRPTVELVLPKDYRGPIRVEVVPGDGPTTDPGLRTFRYDVPAAGLVRVEGPPVLRLLLKQDIRAVYADGSELSRNGHELDVAFRWVRSVAGGEEFVVGSKADWLAARRGGG